MVDQSTTSSTPVTSASAKRGILYVKWGPENSVLQRSANSVRAFHPELPIHVHRLPDSATLLDKAAMMDFSPFDETLFLDIDTIVMGRLDFGFDMANRYGLACTISECPWGRRNACITDDLVEYSTAVLFFTKKAQPIFDSWKAQAHTLDSSIRFYNGPERVSLLPCNDQAAFSLAVDEAPALPFILPLNWNFRPFYHRAWFGPVKIWHAYPNPPLDFVEFTKAQSKPGAIIQVGSLAANWLDNSPRS